MARPQLEDGHTRIANEILEHLAKMHLAPNQWQVLLCIIRKTYGFHKKVDYIANSQIVEATGLCKAVVSRVLHNLNDMNIIDRKGKYIGFQKDWEQWEGLAEQSTLVLKLAEQQTKEKLAILSTKLAESSTELAISSTKVSSPAVTQKIKDTSTKDTIQKKEDLSQKFNIFWMSYPRKVAKADAEKAFTKIKPDTELLQTMLSTIEQAKKSEGWLKENGKFIPHPTTWLNGRRWEDEILKGGQSGTHRRSSRKLPQTYRSPEEIFPDSDG